MQLARSRPDELLIWLYLVSIPSVNPSIIFRFEFVP